MLLRPNPLKVPRQQVAFKRIRSTSHQLPISPAPPQALGLEASPRQATYKRSLKQHTSPTESKHVNVTAHRHVSAPARVCTLPAPQCHIYARTRCACAGAPDNTAHSSRRVCVNQRASPCHTAAVRLLRTSRLIALLGSATHGRRQGPPIFQPAVVGAPRKTSAADESDVIVVPHRCAPDLTRHLSGRVYIYI